MDASIGGILRQLSAVRGNRGGEPLRWEKNRVDVSLRGSGSVSGRLWFCKRRSLRENCEPTEFRGYYRPPPIFATVNQSNDRTCNTRRVQPGLISKQGNPMPTKRYTRSEVRPIISFNDTHGRWKNTPVEREGRWEANKAEVAKGSDRGCDPVTHKCTAPQCHYIGQTTFLTRYRLPDSTPTTTYRYTTSVTRQTYRIPGYPLESSREFAGRMHRRVARFIHTIYTSSFANANASAINGNMVFPQFRA